MKSPEANSTADMPWISVVDEGSADELLTLLYEGSRIPPIGRLAEIYRAQSLRPELIAAYQALAHAIIDGSGSSLPMRERQLIAAYVSHLNKCGYCLSWHGTLARKFIGDDDYFHRCLDDPKNAESARSRELLRYAHRLTTMPHQVTVSDILALRDVGLRDIEILDLNQVAALLNYSNRVALGLGVPTEPEVIVESQKMYSRERATRD